MPKEEKTYIDGLNELWKAVESDSIPNPEKAKIQFLINELERLLERYSA